MVHLFYLLIYLWVECHQQSHFNSQYTIQFFVSSATNCSPLSNITLSSNSCNFHTLSLNNLTNSSTNISFAVVTKCAIFDNLLHTTRIVSFSATNGNFVMKSTIKCAYGISSISFTINFSTGISVLFFIIWHKSHSSTYFYFSMSFVTHGHQ